VVPAPDDADLEPDDSKDEAAVRAANRAFYDAFEARDLEAMSDVWEHSDRVSCTHPGWRRLHGWGAVSGSFLALFQGTQRLQFILTDVRVEEDGDVAWVSLDENILSEQVGGTVSTVNVFARVGDGGWRMVVHHGSPVAATGVEAE
jgi:ketosteroid isomerase-like protein